MARDEKIFTLRIDSSLLEYLKARAEANKRSIAKELEFIVETLKANDEDEIKKELKKYVLILQGNMSLDKAVQTVKNYFILKEEREHRVSEIAKEAIIDYLDSLVDKLKI